ncbi:adp-ribosylation factor-like protein 5a [Ceraceosorus bombacis]|uniref:Adp-ribosylation factor-like protein 5a n=2 Tax=Ceraceosorus TaxID=401624 RepID=A0A0P1BE42_9BASI|nr:putative ARL1-ADP-ribosylation factor [Ceraceosorus guamensis]PWN40348.1 putative ARL1-ADP-ribosylation factor [Ceraceosorus guamensis]CEH14069.1 adp-ribosylation factor-like protein 5a [Ceraceosorus bombacis]
MGLAISTLWSSLLGRSKELKICILGLDNAGKTTLCYQMSMGQAVATAPTVGSNTEQFTFKNLSFILWDVGGQASLRASWTSYLAGLGEGKGGVVFVFDSTDRERISVALQELHRVAGDEQVQTAPLLIFANKQDVQGCLNPAEISDALNLTALRLRDWHIQGCSALTGKGVTEGLDWLAARLAG